MPKLDLSGARYRLEHAKRRVAEAEAELILFAKSEPAGIYCEVDAKRQEKIYKVRLTKPVPSGVPGVVFDSLGGLRSSLDLGAYATAVAGGAPYGGKLNAHFPFRLNANEIDGARTGLSKDVPKEFFDLMAGFKPYKGGNDSLWALNELTNTDKHRILVPYVAQVTEQFIRYLAPDELIWFGAPPRWDSDKNEAVFLRTAIDAQVKFDIEFTLFITFANIDVLRGKPVNTVLHGFTAEVSTILDAIEAEATRIGL